ncbi:unnamed protein product [Paramecium octaurelia]|uniref:Uncharacterized protein n=1 Tax=Paramecium octaurelia TaxID=43137 RepID=A0A8S1SCN5_PAROT|nr:unnamed protein product [Paramecium octaurelia]
MGSSSTKPKEKEKNNLAKQSAQLNQAKPYEYKKEESTNQQNQTQANNSTYNLQNCNIYMIKPINNLLANKKMQENNHFIQPKQKQNFQNLLECPEINLPNHSNFIYQQQQQLFNFDQHCTLQEAKQKIDHEVSKDGFLNCNRYYQYDNLQQRQNNKRAMSNQKQQQDAKQNYQNAEKVQFSVNNDNSQQIAQKLFPPTPPTLQQIQQQSKNQEKRLKPIEINKIQEKEDEDQIYIYNQIFNTQTQGRFSNKLPCKHSQCKTIATINAKGDVGCENKCPSYPIEKAIFNNKKNTIFCIIQDKYYDVNIYNQVANQLQLVQILKDSLLCSNRSQIEQDQFQKKFASVICKYVINKVRQNNQ